MNIGQSAGKMKSLAYFIGVYLGDGWLGYVESNTSWLFRLNSIDEDFVLKTRDVIYDLTGNKGSICSHAVKRSKRLNYSLGIGAKSLFWVKWESNEKSEFPSVVKKFNRSEKLALLAGLLDSEGYVAKSCTHPNSITIGIKATNKWMVDLYKICQSLGIKIGKVGHETLKSGKVAARFHFNAMSFVKNGCYFNIIRKQQRIDQWISNPQRLYARHVSDDIVRTT